MIDIAEPGTTPCTTPGDLFIDALSAVSELKKRRGDRALALAVHEELGLDTAPILERCSEPTAVLFRQIATPTHETLRFLALAKESGLRPLIIEYYGDTFVGAGNSYKRALGKMPIYQYTGSDGRDMVRYRTVLDFNSNTGKSFSNIRMIDNETLVDFHHRLFEKVTGIPSRDICYDATTWFDSHGGEARTYYKPLLSLFIRDAILFDNFKLDAHEKRFTTDIVIPAFDAVVARFGLRPLVIPLTPRDEESRLYWDEYPIDPMSGAT